MKFDMVAILPAGGHSGLAERPGINRRRLLDVMTERNQLASHMVCRHISFDADQALRHIREPGPNPTAANSPTHGH